MREESTGPKYRLSTPSDLRLATQSNPSAMLQVPLSAVTKKGRIQVILRGVTAIDDDPVTVLDGD